MNQPIEHSERWALIARFLLMITIGDTLLCLISFWWMKSDFSDNFHLFGNDKLADAIVFAVIETFSFGALLILVLLAGTGMLAGYIFKYPLREYLMAFVCSLVAVLYINTYG